MNLIMCFSDGKSLAIKFDDAEMAINLMNDIESGKFNKYWRPADHIMINIEQIVSIELTDKDIKIAEKPIEPEVL